MTLKPKEAVKTATEKTNDAIRKIAEKVGPAELIKPPHFDLNDCLAIISAHPIGHCTPHLVNWLRDIGIPANRIVVHWSKKRDISSEYNYGIKYCALESKFNHFIFADNDIKPNPRATKPFLDLTEDISCVEYAAEIPHEVAWGTQTAFHSGLWKCKRHVLERMERPWFRYESIDDGCAFQHCICVDFARRAMRMGFTIGHAGFADHTPQRKTGK